MTPLRQILSSILFTSIGLLSTIVEATEVCEFSAFPVPILFYTPETDVGLGVGYPTSFKSGDRCAERRVNLLIPALIYTSKQQSVGRIFSKQFFNEEKYLIDFVGAFNRYPDKYYGIGDRTAIQDEEVFTEVYASVAADLYRRIVDNGYLGVGLSRDVFRIEDIEGSRTLSSGAVVGGDSGAIAGVGAKVLFNDRNNEFQATRGLIFEGGVVKFDESFGSDFNYLQNRARLRTYLPTTPGQVVALDFLWEEAIGSVPFRKLAQLGGQNFLRGYFLGRYRNNVVVGAQAELRQELSDRWSVVGFAGTAKVASNASSLPRARLISSAGSGLRYVLDLQSRINIRLDLAGGGDSRAVYFGVGEAF